MATHEPRRRRVASFLLLALSSCALACVLVASLRLLERLGVLALSRRPAVHALRFRDALGVGLAIVNSDVTSGSFLLAFDDRPAESVRRLWIPARSVLIERMLASEQRSNPM